MNPSVHRWSGRGLLPLTFLAVLLALGLAGCGGGGGSDLGSASDTPCREALIGPGEPAPELTLVGPEGGDSRVALSEIAGGRVTLVDVWATWCAPCIAAMPHLEEMQEKYGAHGFTVVGIMSDGNATRRGPEWVAEKDLNYPTLFDDNSEGLICQWGPFGGYPTLFLLDRDGTVVDVFTGGDIERVERRVEELVMATGGGTTEDETANS